MTREVVAAYGFGLASGGLIWLLTTYWFDRQDRARARHDRARHSYAVGGPVSTGGPVLLEPGEELIEPADLDRALHVEPVEPLGYLTLNRTAITEAEAEAIRARFEQSAGYPVQLVPDRDVEWIDGPRAEYIELPGWRDRLKRRGKR